MPSLIIFAIILVAMVFASYKTGKLTLVASLTGGLVAIAIYLGVGLGGIALLGAFFLLGTLATSWKKHEKRTLSPDKIHPEKRNAAQVLANGGMAAILGLWAYLQPQYTAVAFALIAAAFASATADTLSSEIGTVYGKRFYNVITFKKDTKGRDGVISLEGTLIGIAGASIVALIYTAFNRFSTMFWFIILAGTIGNLADSILGATLERRGLINNEVVNFLNTAIAALVLWLMI